MMNQLFLNTRKIAFALAGGACIGLPLVSAGISNAQGMNSMPQQSPLSQSTQASPYLNPCPGIYYEEPFNSTRIVPPGCPANAATLNQQGQVQPINQPGSMQPMNQAPINQQAPMQPINSGTPLSAPSATSTERPVSVSTATSPYLNPCPGIYYEEPFNSTRIVPQGCPANSATLNQ